MFGWRTFGWWTFGWRMFGRWTFGWLSLLHTSAARRGAARLNKIEIMAVVHYLYICAARQLAVRRGFFYLENFLFFKKTARFFLCFTEVFLDIWIFHIFKIVAYHRTLHKYYINWKTKCKHTGSL